MQETVKGKQIALKDKRNIKKQMECAYIVNVTVISKTYRVHAGNKQDN